MQRRISEPLQVNDLVKSLQVSRRTLEVRFRATLGRTPHDELFRRRIQQVKDLLLYTGWTLRQIAARTGFRHVEHLHHAFRRAVGQTPGAFRELAVRAKSPFGSTTPPV
jgi:LacI family transcriptional regulator